MIRVINAWLNKGLAAMDIAVDLGPLRCVTTTFQPFIPSALHRLADQYADDTAYFRSGTNLAIQYTETAAINVLRRKDTQACLA